MIIQKHSKRAHLLDPKHSCFDTEKYFWPNPRRKSANQGQLDNATDSKVRKSKVFNYKITIIGMALLNKLSELYDRVSVLLLKLLAISMI